MQKTDKPSIGKRLAIKFRRPIVVGVLFVTPIVITYLVLKLLFNAIDGLLQPGVEVLFDRRIPGLGLIALIILVYLIGFLGSNILGRWLVRLIQRIFLRMPIVSVVYSAAKQLMESFSGTGSTGFKRVVIIEYPRKDVWAFGFLTSMTTDENGKAMALVYMPTAPMPNSGWVAMLPAEDVYDTDMTVQEALRLVLSGGIVAPPQVRRKTPLQKTDTESL